MKKAYWTALLWWLVGPLSAEKAKPAAPVNAPPPSVSVSTVSVAISTPTAPVPVVTAPAPAPPVPPRLQAPAAPAMNEMRGTVESADPDDRMVRLTVEGGVNVEFTYNSQTVFKGVGAPHTGADLNFGDHIVVRYAGKDMNASEIERLSSAPNTLPSAPSE